MHKSSAPSSILGVWRTRRSPSINVSPLYLFAALQRQLNYPGVPRPKKADPREEMLPRLLRTVEQLQTRVKLLEDEQREKGIDLSQFYPDPRKEAGG